MHRSVKGASKTIIREEAEKYTGRKMTNGQAKKWLRKQTRDPFAWASRPLRAKWVWPQVPTLPTLYGGMAALVRKSNEVPFGWGRLDNPGMSEGIQMPLWFWWGYNALEFLKAAPARIGLWILGLRRNA